MADTSKTTTTLIRMGASRFDITISGHPTVNLLAVPRGGYSTPARSHELSEAAAVICQLHGIKENRWAQRRPYKGKRPVKEVHTPRYPSRRFEAPAQHHASL